MSRLTVMLTSGTSLPLPSGPTDPYTVTCCSELNSCGHGAGVPGRPASFGGAGVAPTRELSSDDDDELARLMIIRSGCPFFGPVAAAAVPSSLAFSSSTFDCRVAKALPKMYRRSGRIVGRLAVRMPTTGSAVVRIHPGAMAAARKKKGKSAYLLQWTRRLGLLTREVALVLNQVGQRLESDASNHHHQESHEKHCADGQLLRSRHLEPPDLVCGKT